MNAVPAGWDAGELKRCCAATYGLDLIGALLGETYHPGGLTLTRRLACAVGLRPGMRVAEVASGPGTTAVALAEEFGVEVVGLELGARSAAGAAARATARQPHPPVRFVVADAEAAPLAGDSMDAVFCECAFCTFPDKPRGAAEMARLLRPGGRVGLSDVVISPEGLPPALRGVAAWIGCLAGAGTTAHYQQLLAGAGLRTVTVERHDAAMAELIGSVETRLLALCLAGMPAVAALDPTQVREVAATARQAVSEGVLGYVLLVAERRDDDDQG